MYLDYYYSKPGLALIVVNRNMSFGQNKNCT